MCVESKIAIRALGLPYKMQARTVLLFDSHGAQTRDQQIWSLHLPIYKGKNHGLLDSHGRKASAFWL